MGKKDYRWYGIIFGGIKSNKPSCKIVQVQQNQSIIIWLLSDEQEMLKVKYKGMERIKTMERWTWTASLGESVAENQSAENF